MRLALSRAVRLAQASRPFLTYSSYSGSCGVRTWYSIKMAIAENYDDVLKGKYPAKQHAKKVAQWIVDKGGDKNGTIYLEAQKQKLNEVRVFEFSRRGCIN